MAEANVTGWIPGVAPGLPPAYDAVTPGRSRTGPVHVRFGG